MFPALKFAVLSALRFCPFVHLLEFLVFPVFETLLVFPALKFSVFPALQFCLEVRLRGSHPKVRPKVNFKVKSAKTLCFFDFSALKFAIFSFEVGTFALLKKLLTSFQ